MSRLSLEKGEVNVDGTIDSLTYSDGGKKFRKRGTIFRETVQIMTASSAVIHQSLLFAQAFVWGICFFGCIRLPWRIIRRRDTPSPLAERCGRYSFLDCAGGGGIWSAFTDMTTVRCAAIQPSDGCGYAALYAASEPSNRGDIRRDF